MEKKLEDILPILAIEHGCILSKQGDITAAFRLQLPEIFSLSNEEYETLHHAWVKAIRILPKHTVVHKQDWFEKKNFTPPKSEHTGFLKASADRHFEGRSYMSHSCYLFITKKPAGRKSGSSMFSNLISNSIVPQQTVSRDALQHFLDACGQLRRILEDTGLIKAVRLGDEELQSNKTQAGIIEQYCFLGNQNGKTISDICFDPGMQVGDKHCQLYTLSDLSTLPAVCGPRINYERFSTDSTKFSIGFATSIGQLLPYDHICNQYIFIEDPQATIKRLETKRIRLQSLSAYSRENSLSCDAVNEFLNEAISAQRLPVKAHFNLLVWTDDRRQLKDMRNAATSALSQMDAIAKQETIGSAQIFWAGLPGNESDFPMNDCFDTFLEQATCFLNHEGEPTTVGPDEGLRFCDRLSNRPLYFDPYTLPRLKGLSSNMGTLVCGASGTGKSMLVNAILNTLYNQGAHCVVIDIGGSYKGLCSLLGGYYFTYEENDPIRFNPFYLGPGEVMDTEKKESLKSLLVALWKSENDYFRRSEYVALSDALSGYYAMLGQSPEVFPCFDSFYEYLRGPYSTILQGHRVKERDFDLDNFLYVLRPYYGDGEFGFLLNARDNLDLLNTRFIVLELDNVKDSPILYSVITLITIELFISKMRKLKGIRKVLAMDEAWKAISKPGMAEFVQYAYKTFRKFNAIPIVATQEVDDLVASPIVKDAIINNSDVKILMDMKKFMNKFDRLQDVLGLSEKAKTILLSVNKDDREVYIDVGGVIQRVYRNELSREEYLAFTSEGNERVKVIDFAERHGGMEHGIRALIESEKKKAS